MPPMPPQPIWKMRSLLFLLVCARPACVKVAAAAVRIAPFLKKVRRVIGEIDFLAFITWKPLSSTGTPTRARKTDRVAESQTHTVGRVAPRAPPKHPKRQ